MTTSDSKIKYQEVSQDHEPRDIQERIFYLINQGKPYFPGDCFDSWQQACNKLLHAGYGSSIPLSYIRESPQLAQLLSAEIAINFSSLVSISAIKLNRATAELLPKSAVIAARKLVTVPGFLSWIMTLEELVKSAPESVSIVLEQTEKILDSLTINQFQSWVTAGLNSCHKDKHRQIQFFSMQDSASEKWFRHAAGDISFTDIKHRLTLYLTSLWKISPPIRPLPAAGSPLSLQRISISNGIARIPEIFPGLRGDQAEGVFRAGLAHVGAHLVYSTKIFPVAELKPIQIALISLLEDARVEYLAMQEFPGLKKVWIPFHVAKSNGPRLVPHLFARLSRALIDNDYIDKDTWVQKARNMFFDSSNDMADPSMCRRIGVLLGNDLGQMRLQFNAKTYVIEPAYRDDNMGLWDCFDHQNEEEDEDLFVESVQMEQYENNDSDSEKHDKKDNDDINEEHQHAHENKDDSILQSEIIIRHPEYDYLTASERPDWTCVTEYFPAKGDALSIDRILEQYGNLVTTITRLIQSAKVSLPVRQYRQSVGDTLDIDACIDAMVSRKMGQTPDTRIYTTTQRRQRDLSVQILLDISNSTNDKVTNTDQSVLQMEIQATSLLAYAMSELADPFGIAAFCSNGKENVNYYHIKKFNEKYDINSRAYLAGLKGKLSTRIGAAMRHAIKDLQTQKTHRRLLLIITDGEPSDIDVSDKNYLIEDARKVVRNASNLGIDIFCVCLETYAKNDLSKIFGKRNIVVINKIERLPEKLPLLYLRLTT